MPFRISRLLCIGGRPPGFARGTSASSCSHSGSVRSVSYALRHVIGAHQHTAPTLFKRALMLTILIQPFASKTPAEAVGLMRTSNLWLGPLQGLVASALGV